MAKHLRGRDARDTNKGSDNVLLRQPCLASPHCVQGAKLLPQLATLSLWEESGLLVKSHGSITQVGHPCNQAEAHYMLRTEEHQIACHSKIEANLRTLVSLIVEITFPQLVLAVECLDPAQALAYTEEK